MTTRRQYSPIERQMIKRGELAKANARYAARHNKRPIPKRVPGGTRVKTP